MLCGEPGVYKTGLQLPDGYPRCSSPPEELESPGLLSHDLDHRDVSR